MTPEQTLKKTKQYERELKKAMGGYIAVGLPSDKVGGQVYGDGETVMQVGAAHEYGVGNMPERSFLRLPFSLKKVDLEKAIFRQFEDVLERGKKAHKALGLIGVTATQVSQDAFDTQGYGKWPDITDATKEAKGSSKVMIDTGILRGSITYVVRGLNNAS